MTESRSCWPFILALPIGHLQYGPIGDGARWQRDAKRNTVARRRPGLLHSAIDANASHLCAYVRTFDEICSVLILRPKGPRRPPHTRAVVRRTQTQRPVRLPVQRGYFQFNIVIKRCTLDTAAAILQATSIAAGQNSKAHAPCLAPLDRILLPLRHCILLLAKGEGAGACGLNAADGSRRAHGIGRWPVLRGQCSICIGCNECGTALPVGRRSNSRQGTTQRLLAHKTSSVC